MLNSRPRVAIAIMGSLCLSMALTTIAVPTATAHSSSSSASEAGGSLTSPTSHESLVGAYEVGPERHLILAYYGDLYLIDSLGGEARRLTPLEGNSYTFGPTRSVSEPVAGDVTFEAFEDGMPTRLRVRRADGSTDAARRVPLRLSEHTFDNGDDARLTGTLVLPEEGAAVGVAVLLGGEGPNDRYDMWPTAMDLALHGVGAFVFDQRNAGASTGVEVEGNYHRRSLAAAADAAAVVRGVMGLARLEGMPVGVAGHSQGGWIGAIVAAEVPDVAFYVNSAGNGSPGWAQWRHGMVSWLHRQQVDPALIPDANTYFDALFGLYHDEIGWEAYAGALERAKASEWWPVLRKRYFAEFASIEEARDYAAAEGDNVPERDFAKVRCPALGVFAQFDGSTTPETPALFLRGLLEGGNGNVTVRLIPGVNHGMWGVQDYRTQSGEITRRSVLWAETIRSWILGVVGEDHGSTATAQLFD